MSDSNYFLTDEFIQFSQKMAELHNEKKTKQNNFAAVKEAFQKKYEEYKIEMAEYDNQAVELAKEWEEWKSSQKQ